METQNGRHHDITDADLAEKIKLAAEAFLYGYPLVYNLREIAKFPAGPNLVQPEPLPYNTFGYARKLLDPKARFVSPSNDTLYLVAMCDVRSGPLVLHVPAPPPVDAFWSLTMYDAHEFYLVENLLNRCSIGDRTSGLTYGVDGSLTIYLQNDSPGED